MNKWNLKFDPNADGGGASPAPPATPVEPAAPPSAKPDAPPASEDDAIDKLMGRDDAAQTERREKIKKVAGEADKPEQAASDITPKEEVKKPAEPATPIRVEEKPVDITEFLKRQTEAIEKLATSRPGEPIKQEPKAEEPKFEFFKASQQDVDDVIEGGEKAMGVIDKVYQRALQDSIQITARLMQETIAPLQRDHMARQVVEAEKRFFTQFKDLEPVADLTREVANKLIGEVNAGRMGKFKDEAEFFTKVAELTKKFIGNLKAPPPVEDTTKTPSPTPAPASGNGRTGREMVRTPKSEDDRLAKELLEEAGIGPGR